MTTTNDKITWSKRAFRVVAKQMMFEINSNRRPSPEEQEEFRERYKPLLEEIIPEIPRGMSSVGAAIAKCAIRYGKAPAIQFAKNVKNMMFQGKNDPCHRYYLWLHGKNRSKQDAVTSYRVTLTACQAFCEGRQLTRLRPSSKDIFQWSAEWLPELQNEAPRRRRGGLFSGPQRLI